MSDATVSEPTVVLKFGGTAVATPARVRCAARRVRAEVRRGRRVVVVVSAAGVTTDRILARIARLGGGGTGDPERAREVDRALTTGEDRSAALLAVALREAGLRARSLRGGEAGVRATGAFGAARLAAVDPAPLAALTADGVVPVVSGFQGLRPDGETATLGRGGSDTTAVAIAAALGAECHIVTDVDAVYDRDPRHHPDARPYRALDHRSLLALVESGARVVHPAAARLALERGVPLRVCHYRPGTGEGTRVGGGESTIRRHRVGRFELECGHVLEDVEQAYTLTGELSERRDNAIVVFHSLTGDADPAGWWREVVGPGRALDTDRYAVLSANLIGSCYGTTRPPAGVVVTPRDMARLTGRLVTGLGIRSVALATGGSLGGMVTLEWAASFPARTRAAVAFAAPAAHTAYAIAHNHVQRQAVELAGSAGLGVARMAAMLTYRTAAELDGRFGRERRADGRYQVQSYLDHHARTFTDRFDPDAYRSLLDAMDAHDVGRGRGGAGAALRRFRGHLVGVGITGDLLYGPDDVRAWTDAAGCEYDEIRSLHGHDAFLLESAAVGAILRRALERAERNEPIHGGVRS